MKKINQTITLVVFSIILLSFSVSNAQNVGINATGTTPDPSAALDIAFTDKGVLIPRIALSSKLDASVIAAPATSLLIYNTATAGTSPNNVRPGFYYWNGTTWVRIKNKTNRKFLPSDVAATTTTLIDVTGLSFPVEIGETYKFKFFIIYTASSTARGSRWALNGPTINFLRCFSTYPSSASANVFYYQSTYNGATITANSGSTTSNIAVIEGIINCSSDASEVIARMAAEAATITAKSGVSFVEWEILD